MTMTQAEVSEALEDARASRLEVVIVDDRGVASRGLVASFDGARVVFQLFGDTRTCTIPLERIARVRILERASSLALRRLAEATGASR